MKRVIFAMLTFAGLMFAAGCNYLDVDPELGITEEEVFGTTTNAMSFIDRLYDANNGKSKATFNLSYPFYVDMCNNAYCQLVATTDAADCGRLTIAQRNFKACNMTQSCLNYYSFSTAVQADKPVAYGMILVIRLANKAIANFDLIKSGKEEEKYDFLGQAYFARAMGHFCLCRMFGGMPYIDKVIGADDEWDMAREPLLDCYVKIAQDFEKAYECFEQAQKVTETGVRYMRRNTPTDLFIGGGTQGAFNLKKPFGCLCLAARSRALLYAASPLSNTANDPELWKKAADASAEALEKCLEYGYTLQDFDTYSNNYYGVMMTNEVLWAYAYNASNTAQNLAGMLSYCQSGYTGIKGTSGTHPTQNFVDRFETIDGVNLYDTDYEKGEQLRAAAAASGSYNPQNPYANRDPRLEKVIIHDGSQFPEKATGDGTFNIYYDPNYKVNNGYPTTKINNKDMAYAGPWGSTDLDIAVISNTGYYCQRHWNGSFTGAYYHLDPCYRLGELYLNYAEAMNEYYGPETVNPEHPALGTAVDNVNIIRNRATMPNVRAEYVAGGKDVMRERIQNERCVEMAYESNHYYFDIRRWKIAPKTMKQTLYGMKVTKTTATSTYPNGRIYERVPIPDNRQQTWKDCMYFLPWPDEQANTMKNFVNNEAWK